MPSPSIVQYNQFEPGNVNSSPLTISLTGTTAGNMLVAILANQGNNFFSSINTPTDGVNTWKSCKNTFFNGGSITQMEMFYASNIVGGNVNLSWSWTGTGTDYQALYIFEVSNVDTYDNGSYGFASSSTANATTSAFNTNFYNEIIIAGTINSNYATGAGAGYTLITITTNYGDALIYNLVGPGSQTATAVLGGTSQNWGIVAGAFYKSSILPTDPMFFWMT